MRIFKLTAIIFIATTLSLDAQVASTMSQAAKVQTEMKKYGETMYYLQNFYIDTLNLSSVTDEALKKVMSQLDPHSVYIPAKEVEAMNEPLEGSFNGIGIEFAVINDTLTVQAPVSGGPSERVGLMAGDKIVAVDGENVAGIGLTTQGVHKYLRGPKGSKVELEIIRKGYSESLDFIVERDKIPLNSIDAWYEVSPGVLYVKLGRFAATSMEEFGNIFREYGTPKGLVLDLRGNSGGFLHIALQLTNQFLEPGSLMLYTEGRMLPRTDEYARGAGLYRKGPLAILIDENSASASEIVSGAVQDWDRGAIIGRRSFGKGLVQRMLPLSDGSQIRLTIARYHTPSGRVIQSHYENGKAEEYYMNLMKRYENGEVFSRDSIEFPDSLKYRTLRKGRTVYGGGGIMPDIFVPLDTAATSELYSTILRGGYAIDFVNAMFDEKREDYKTRYPDFASLDSSFLNDNDILGEFSEYLVSRGVSVSSADMEKSGVEITSFLKALVARNLFGMNEYFRIINEDDGAYRKALDYVNSEIRS